MLQSITIVLVLVVTCRLARCNTSLSNWTSCAHICSCAEDSLGLHARCDLQALPDAKLNLLPKELYSLSIQNTSIQRIPAESFQWFHNLRNLILRNNSLQSIETGAIETLVKLKTIDLRDNDLKTWQVESNEVLPYLEIIDVTGNNRWVPDEEILRLRSLREIRGLKWSESCGDCNLLKVGQYSGNESEDLSANGTEDSFASMACHVTLDAFFIHYKEVNYEMAAKFVRLGFSPQCLCYSLECFNHEITYPYFRQLNDLPKKLFYTEYVLGSVLLSVNIAIVMVVLCSRSLRTSGSFILICSMAMSDVLVGVYTIGIAVFNPFTAVTVTPNKMMDNDISVCPYLGFVFTTGQTTTVFTSLLLTVERYLAIVHCDNPGLRMTTKASLALSAVIWLLAILYALLPIIGVEQLQYHKWFQCTMPFHKSSAMLDDTSTATLVIAVGFVLIYVASVGLYVRIYFYVRKASATFSARVQREARLARRIALVVCTNFIFFVTPIVLFLIYVYQFMDVLLDVGNTFVSLRGFIIMGSWVPVTLLAINSFLNPILYAFRHQKFQREVKKLSRRVNGNFRESIFVSQDSRLKRNNSSLRRGCDPCSKDNDRFLGENNGESTIEMELTKLSPK